MACANYRNHHLQGTVLMGPVVHEILKNDSVSFQGDIMYKTVVIGHLH